MGRTGVLISTDCWKQKNEEPFGQMKCRHRVDFTLTFTDGDESSDGPMEHSRRPSSPTARPIRIVDSFGTPHDAAIAIFSK